FIDRLLAPVVRAAGVLVGVFGPRLVSGLAGERNGVELPDELAAHDVVRADVAGWRHPCLAGRGPDDHQVFPDLAGTLRLHAPIGAFRAREALPEIDDAAGAEGEDRFAGPHVNGLQITVDGKEQPPILSVRALPVIDAAGVHAR